MKTTRMLLILVLALVVGLPAGVANADFTFGEPTNLGPTINSPHVEDPGSISSDGLSLYFRSNPSGSFKDDIYVSTRTTTDDAWGTPVKLGPPVNSSGLDAGAIISTDGLSLYFTSLNRAGGYGSLDVWVATRATVSDPWCEPSNLGPTINTSQDDIATSISCDGLVLYFYRKPPPKGPGDIYMSTRPTTNDAWGEPVNLGPTVNSSASDGSPCISANGLLLFFHSNRPGGFGDHDLYMTRRATIDDDWGMPVNLGPVVNSSASDYAATILPDGSTLYFASERPGGYGDRDLWQVPIIPIVDFNGDEIVDIEDLVKLIEHWGTDEPLCDIGPIPWGDGVVDEADLEVLISYWQQEFEFLPFDLLAYWKLDEAEGIIAYESAGDKDGTVNGEPLWQPTGGNVDGALQFDGTDDYVSTDFVLNPEDGAFSVFVWIKGGAPGQVVLSQIGGANWLSADSLEGNLMTELKTLGRGGDVPIVSETVITDGNWHRIGFVWDGSYRYLYVDGAEVAKDAKSFSMLESSDGGLYLGASKNLEAGTFFSGLIDDVRIYNRAITP